jgi:hypothetical protein
VSITALSAVGAAFSAGAGVGAGVAVCARTPELNVRAAAIAAIAIQYPLPCDIAVSPLNFCRTIEDLDHYEAGKACKSESAQKRRPYGPAATVF